MSDEKRLFVGISKPKHHEITFEVHGRLNDVDEYRANLVHHISANFSITVQGVEGRGNSKAEAIHALRDSLERLQADQWSAVSHSLVPFLYQPKGSE